MLAPSTSFYEKQKRIYERIANLERERLDTEQKVTNARIESHTAAAENLSGIERLRKNVRDAQTKIAENRELMREVDRLLLKLDSVSDECEYLESLKNNMVDYAREAYERWSSEDPQRAAKYWAEKGKLDVSLNRSDQSKMTSPKRENVQDNRVTMDASERLQQSNQPEVLEASSSSLRKIDSPKKGKSPRFNERVQVAEFYEESEENVAGGLRETFNRSNTSVSPEPFSTARSKSLEVDDDFLTSRDQNLKAPKKDLSTGKTRPKSSEQTPMEFFSASSNPSKLLAAKSASFQGFGEISSEERLNRSESDRSFSERRSLDQKNEFCLDLDSDSNFVLTDKPPSDKNVMLTFKGLQSLFHRIEDCVTDQLSPRDEMYSVRVKVSYDYYSLVTKANNNQLENESAQICSQVALKCLPDFFTEGTLFKPGVILEDISTFSDLDDLIDASKKPLYVLIRDHLKYIALKNAVDVDNLSTIFAELLEQKHKEDLRRALKLCLESVLKEEEFSEATSISAFSTPRSISNSPAVKSSTPRKPILKNSPSVSFETEEMSRSKNGISKADADKKSDKLNESKTSKASTSKSSSKEAKNDNEDEDSFPFTSQSLDDHLDISLQSGKAEKTSNAYQSLLKNVFGGTDPTKAKSSERVMNKSDEDDSDEMDAILGGSTSAGKIGFYS